MIFQMITGKLPFIADNFFSLKTKVIKGDPHYQCILFHNFNNFSASVWEDKSNCKDFVLNLICPAIRRMTPAKALNHPWMQQFSEVGVVDLSRYDDKVAENLLRFQRSETLKQAILTYLATQACDKEVDEMRLAFMAMDTNSDGKLSKEELSKGLKGKIEEEDINHLLEKIDIDGNGTISYNGNYLNVNYRISCCCNGTENMLK